MYIVCYLGPFQTFARSYKPMNKFAILLSLLSLSFTPLLAEENESAYKLCNSLSFSSEKMECMKVVKDKYFFDQAVQVCSSLPFSSEKINCLKVIANKSFSTSALAICSRLSFSSEKIVCLKNAASELEPCIQIEEIESSVYQALGELRRGRPSRAEFSLEKLLDRIQDCRR